MSAPSAIQDLIAAACDGDALSAARAAMRLHGHVDTDSAGSHLTADQLVTMAIASDDPEFLVELGDALCVGTILPLRPSLTRACYERADKLSPFMGAYALGMSRGLIDPQSSLRYLRKAASHGHWASQVVLFWIDMPEGWVRKTLWRWRFKFQQLPSILRVVRGQRDDAFLWRYGDVVPSTKGGLRRMLGSDRKKYLTLDHESPPAALGELFVPRRNIPTLNGSTKRFYVYFRREEIREVLSVRQKLLCALPSGGLVHAVEKGVRGPHPLAKFEIACPDSIYEDVRGIIDAERGGFSVLCSDARNRVEEELIEQSNWLGEIRRHEDR